MKNVDLRFLSLRVRSVENIFKGFAGITICAGLIAFIYLAWDAPGTHVGTSVATTGPVVPAPSLSAYEEVIIKRNLFAMTRDSASPPLAKRAAVTKTLAVPAVPKLTIAELAADYALVGVLEDGHQAAISSKKSGETTYVTVGQSLGPLKVSAIGSSRVTLMYEGQSVDLSL